MIINMKALGKAAGRAMKKAQTERAMKKAQTEKAKTGSSKPVMDDTTRARLKAAAKKVKPRLSFKDGGSVKNRSKSSCK